MTYVPPKYEIVSTEELNEDTPRVNFAKVKERRLGLYFKFNSFVYLYGYPKTHYEFDDLDLQNDVTLIDLREYDGNEDIPFYLTGNEIRLVEITESNGVFVLSELLLIDTVDIEYWVIQGLETVFERMHDRYVMNRLIIEESDNFLSR